MGGAGVDVADDNAEVVGDVDVALDVAEARKSTPTGVELALAPMSNDSAATGRSCPGGEGMLESVAGVIEVRSGGGGVGVEGGTTAIAEIAPSVP